MNNVKLNEMLKKLRGNCGYSQSHVAKEVGVARTTYTAYENGTKFPQLHTIVKLSELFNVSLDELICDIKSPNNYIIDGEIITDKEWVAIESFIRLYRTKWF